MFLKMKTNGVVKARLVAVGDGKDKSVYDKSVRSLTTIHLQNCYVVNNNMNNCSMDVNGAFLEANLPEPIYMHLSKDVTEVVRRLYPDAICNRSTVIVKLKKW